MTLHLHTCVDKLGVCQCVHQSRPWCACPRVIKGSGRAWGWIGGPQSPRGAGQGLQKGVEAQWALDSESSCPGGGCRAGRLRQP